MAGITKDLAAAKLRQWLAAEDRIMSGQSYTIGSIRYSRADLSAVRDSIKYWQALCQQLDPASQRPIRVREVIPR